MTEVPYPADESRLVENIRDELLAQTAGFDLPLDEGTIDTLANGLASSILYGFSVTWRPRWATEDRHAWTEHTDDGERFYVECVKCRRLSVHQSPEDAAEWWDAHRTAHDS